MYVNDVMTRQILFKAHKNSQDLGLIVALGNFVNSSQLCKRNQFQELFNILINNLFFLGNPQLFFKGKARWFCLLY